MLGKRWTCIHQGYLLILGATAAPVPITAEFPAQAWAFPAIATGSQCEERGPTPSSRERLPSCPGGRAWFACHPEEVGFTQGEGKLSE